MAGNDPNVHGLHGPSETQGVGQEAPKIDARIQDRGAAAGRVKGAGGGAEPTASDGLQLSEVEEEAPLAPSMLAALTPLETEEDRQRQILVGQLRTLDARIDESERRLHDAIAEGDMGTAEREANGLTAIFRERAAVTEELERVGAEQPLPSEDEPWIEGDAQRPSTAPPLSDDDARLAAFIESVLGEAASPARGQGPTLVAQGRAHAVDPLLLLAVATHETDLGRSGDRLFGLGPASLEGQVQAAAEAFARLRRAGGSGPDDEPAGQAGAVARAGWSAAEGWGEAVTAHHARLLSRWRA
jgi:hypothetical protein